MKIIEIDNKQFKKIRNNEVLQERFKLHKVTQTLKQGEEVYIQHMNIKYTCTVEKVVGNKVCFYYAIPKLFAKNYYEELYIRKQCQLQRLNELKRRYKKEIEFMIKYSPSLKDYQVKPEQYVDTSTSIKEGLDTSTLEHRLIIDINFDRNVRHVIDGMLSEKDKQVHMDKIEQQIAPLGNKYGEKEIPF